MSSGLTPPNLRASSSCAAFWLACSSASLAEAACVCTPSCTTAVSGVPDAVPSAVTVTVRSGAFVPDPPPPPLGRGRGRRRLRVGRLRSVVDHRHHRHRCRSRRHRGHQRPHPSCTHRRPSLSLGIGRRDRPVGSRLAGWGRGPSPPAPGPPDAGQAHHRHAGRRRLALRAQVGRLPVHRLPRRRRRGAGQPQRAPADPLLPGDHRAPQGAAAGAVRGRRRDRRAVDGRRRPRLRRAAAAHPPGGVTGAAPGRGDAGVGRAVRRAGRRRSRRDRRAPQRAPRRPPRPAAAPRAAALPDARLGGPRGGRRLVPPLRGRRASTASWPSASTAPTRPTSGR